MCWESSKNATAVILGVWAASLRTVENQQSSRMVNKVILLKGQGATISGLRFTEEK
jgi:hypothetical protein